MNRRKRATVPLTWPPLGLFLGADYIALNGDELVEARRCGLICTQASRLLCCGRRVLYDGVPLTPERFAAITSSTPRPEHVRALLRL